MYVNTQHLTVYQAQQISYTQATEKCHLACTVPCFCVSLLNCKAFGSSTVIVICSCRVLSTTETWSSLWLLVTTILIKEQSKNCKSRRGGFLECMGRNSNVEILDFLDFYDLLQCFLLKNLMAKKIIKYSQRQKESVFFWRIPCIYSCISN